MDKLTQKTADFLLPSFGKDGAPRNTPMTYAESAGLTRVVLSKLTLPEFDEDSLTWSLSLEPIMSAELCQMFTEHSGRPVLPTAAQCLQFSKDESDHLGRCLQEAPMSMHVHIGSSCRTFRLKFVTQSSDVIEDSSSTKFWTV